jgi:hypothetical protein
MTVPNPAPFFGSTAATDSIDGHYHLDAGAVCLPGFWRLREKFRMSLDTLHFEAAVPHYAEKLQKSMNRFFKTLPAARPVVRNNVPPSSLRLFSATSR